MKKLFWGLGIAVVLFALYGGKSASAQGTGLFLTTTVSNTRVKADPGTTADVEIQVKNMGVAPERLKISLLKFSASGEEGRPNLAERGPGDDYFDWVTFSPSKFDAKPNEWVKVQMKIKIPKTAGLGYYYAVTFARESESAAKDRSVVIGSSAQLVLLEVNSPNARRSLDLLEFKTEKKWYEFLPVKMTVRVKNSGNIHLVPVGNIFIKKGDKVVATLDFNKAQGNVLPYSNRIFVNEWQDGFPLYKDKIVDDKPAYNSDGSSKRDLSWNFSEISKLRFGKYTAKLLVVYNDGTRDVPIESEVSFWVVPWRIIGGFVVFLALAGVGAWAIGRIFWDRFRGSHRKYRS
ncbi:MAG: exported protein of unknown function [Candidatus Saccharibacteria bacterium]|nr:exported protein of unknown function [Candidatus Saccharibacteria bacterium]